MFNKNLNGNPKMKTLIETLMETSMLSVLKKKSLGSNPHPRGRPGSSKAVARGRINRTLRRHAATLAQPS